MPNEIKRSRNYQFDVTEFVLPIFLFYFSSIWFSQKQQQQQQQQQQCQMK